MEASAPLAGDRGGVEKNADQRGLIRGVEHRAATQQAIGRRMAVGVHGRARGGPGVVQDGGRPAAGMGQGSATPAAGSRCFSGRLGGGGGVRADAAAGEAGGGSGGGGGGGGSGAAAAAGRGVHRAPGCARWVEQRWYWLLLVREEGVGCGALRCAALRCAAARRLAAAGRQRPVADNARRCRRFVTAMAGEIASGTWCAGSLAP